MNNILADFYERDIRKLIEEVRLFKNEENLWKKEGHVPNSCGNLALHIIGNLNHFIGATLAATGYVRDRDSEFTKRDVPRDRKSTRLNSSHVKISYAVFCLK